MQRYCQGRVIIEQGELAKLAVRYGLDVLVHPSTARLESISAMRSPSQRLEVDDSVWRVGGAALVEACLGHGVCEPGEAKATPGFGLAVKWVVHAVGPIWQGGQRGEDTTLRCCYERSLQLAMAHGALSVGLGPIAPPDFPGERAARIAISTMLDFLEHHAAIERVVFACLSEEDEAIYAAIMCEYL